MNEIIVAIDFSSNSLNALDHSVYIANAFNANVTLLNICKACNEESIYPESTDLYYKEAKKRLGKLEEEYKPKFNNNVKAKIRVGKVYSEIANEAKSQEAVLIIVGTHGVSGFEEYFIGSNAYRLVTITPCPILTIKPESDKMKIKKILFPIDSSADTRQKTNFAIELVTKFDAELRILGVYDTGLKDVRNKIKNYVHQVKEIFDGKGIKSTVDFAEGKKASGIILDYINIHDMDMVLMMSDKDHSTMIIGNEAQRIINQAPVPVLSIHPKITSSSGISMSGMG